MKTTQIAKLQGRVGVRLKTGIWLTPLCKNPQTQVCAVWKLVANALSCPVRGSADALHLLRLIHW